ncbi:MAG TPA: amino acid ABC transporter substrate-binding protein [Oxalobacteraceae bacterium]|nr:amino acid ABC transporter substrate-binding protein [Oxalobacteraceae bacterium]
MSQTEPIKVGILYSETGVTSAIESSQLLGTIFAIEEINQSGGINGREIVPVRYDPQSDPARYRALAEHLVSIDNVKVIFGCYMSSTRKAVIPVVERWNRILFYATLYEGFEFSNNLIYTGAAPNQNSVQLADFMMSAFGARVYLVGSDYIYPYESNRIMTDLVMQRQGGETMGKRYVPLDATERDFTGIVADIKEQQPDFIFSTVVGDSTQYFYRAYAEAGLDPKKIPIASLTTCEVEVAQMGAAVAAGHFTSSPYFQSIDSPTNHACLAKFRARFGELAEPNASWEAAYFQLHLFANAMRAAGSDDIDALMPELLGAEFLAPQGRVRVEPNNHHTCLYPRIGRVNAKGQFTIVRQSTRAVAPDPYLVTHSLGDWTLALSSLET